MQELLDKVKVFFKDKLNIIALGLFLAFLIMVIIPVNNEICSKISMLFLAGGLAIISYKFYKKHKAIKEIYDNIDSFRQENNENTFTRLSSKIENFTKLNYLTYAVIFAIIDVIILICMFF